MHLNYTTYDVRRNGDVIISRTYPDIIVKSPEAGPQAQSFWYACMLGIFHTLVTSTHQEVQDRSLHQIEFLWVQWFGMKPGPYHHGFCYTRLPKIGFVGSSDEYAFMFL